MTPPRCRMRRGVTLIELLVAVAILGIVSAAIVAIWFGSQRSFDTGNAIAEAQANARIAMAALEREVRSGSQSSVALGANSLAFATYLPDATTPTQVRYFVDGSDLVREEAGGARRSVATDVAELNVAVGTGETIVVALLVRVRDREAALSTEVQFRNP